MGRKSGWAQRAGRLGKSLGALPTGVKGRAPARGAVRGAQGPCEPHGCGVPTGQLMRARVGGAGGGRSGWLPLMDGRPSAYAPVAHPSMRPNPIPLHILLVVSLAALAAPARAAGLDLP